MANTTADKLALAITSKEDIKTAIEEMGGTFASEADSEKLSAFGDAVRSIPTGGADMVDSLEAETPTNIKAGYLRIVKAQMVDDDGVGVTDTLGNPLYTYSLYIWQVDETYPDGHFVPAHGAYNAENVYFDEDLQTTSAIGNITLSNGQATIAAKGKNLAQVFETIFVKEVNTGLRSTYPYVTTNISSVSWQPLGTAASSKDVTIQFNDGTYKYGPTPGCTAKEYYFDNVSNGTNATKTITGDFSQKGYTKVAVKADYNAATASPVSNTGNVYADQKFAAGTAYEKNKSTALSVSVYGCYIPLYWGFKDSSNAIANPAAITPAEIKALGNTITDATAYNGTVGKETTSAHFAFRTNLTASSSFKQMFYAVPTCFTKQLTAVVDKNGLPLTPKATSEIAVTFGEGANAVTQNYKVYYVALDALYNTLELTLTWA